MIQKTVDQSLLVKKVYFPKMRFLHLPKQKGIIKKALNFATLKRKVEFLEEFCIWCPRLDKFIYIPKNFIADGASVPKVLHSVYGSFGILFYGSIPHDFGHKYHGLFIVSKYRKVSFQIFPKEELDAIFKNVNLLETDKRNAVGTAKKFLDWFSGPAWKRNREKNRNVFKDFPELLSTENMN